METKQPENKTAPAGTKMTAADEVCKSITSREADFKMALPPQIPSARFIRVATTAVRVKPSLLELDRNSLYAALHDAAAQGLLPDNREGAIVPFKGKAKFMPMVAGILKKARNSGEIKTIGCQVVYANDTYESWEDELGPHFKFKKATGDRGSIVTTFAYAITKDGGIYFEEVSEPEMLKIKAMSKADDSPWKGAFEDEMRKKSALRRLLKHRVPSSTDLDAVVRADDEIYEPEPAIVTPPTPTSSRLRAAIDTTIVTPAYEPGEDNTEPVEADLPI